MPGNPIPKRSEDRRRRNKVVGETLAPSGPTVTIPEPDEDWHEIALMFWESFKESGQTAFWQSSDWVVAYDAMEDLSYYKRTLKRSSMLRSAVDSTLARLMATEGDRRRLRLELARHEVDLDEQAAVTAMESYRNAVGA